MSTTGLIVSFIFLYALGAGLIIWLIARARPLETVDGRTEAAPGSTAAPLVAPPAGRRSSVDADSPPVTLKLPPAHSDGDYLVTCKRVLLITGCTDSSMWYSKMVGKEVPYLGEWKADGCFKSREPAGYVNIVWFKDARVIIKEAA